VPGIEPGGGGDDLREDPGQAQAEQRETGDGRGRGADSRPATSPRPATRPLARTSRTGPNRAASRSPAARPAAIVTENAPSATAATAADEPRLTCR